MKKNNSELKERILNYIILFGILMILFAGGMTFKEFEKAKDFCISIEGNYSMKFPNHFCNGYKMIQYDYGWDFERNYKIEINLSLIP